MDYKVVNLGFSTADAQDVSISFDGSDLTLTCVNWHGEPVKHVFNDALAYRWGQDLGSKEVHDDETYEVQNSQWLLQEAPLIGVDPSAYVHLKLCFNARGVLDVLSRRSDA